MIIPEPRLGSSSIYNEQGSINGMTRLIPRLYDKRFDPIVPGLLDYWIIGSNISSYKRGSGVDLIRYEGIFELNLVQLSGGSSPICSCIKFGPRTIRLKFVI